MIIWRNKYRPWQKIAIHDLKNKRYYNYETGTFQVSLIALNCLYEPENWRNRFWPLFHIKIRIMGLVLSLFILIAGLFAGMFLYLPIIICALWLNLTNVRYGTHENASNGPPLV